MKYGTFLSGEIDGEIKLKYDPRSKSQTAFKDWPLRNELWSGGMEAETV